MKVLVVDDYDDGRMLDRILLSCRHDCLEAHNGEQALAIMVTWKPDVVLLDLHMPGMGGKECLRRIRLNPEWNDVAVVVCSFLVNEKEECLRLGATLFTPKPTTSEEMLSIFQQLAEAKTLRES